MSATDTEKADPVSKPNENERGTEKEEKEQKEQTKKGQE